MTAAVDAQPGKMELTQDKQKYFRKGLGDVTPNNINQLKRLNSVLFPVKYKEQFYTDALNAGEYVQLGNQRVMNDY
jgi:hypothetical protein